MNEQQIRQIVIALFNLSHSKNEDTLLSVSQILGKIGALNLNVAGEPKTHREWYDCTQLIIYILNNFLRNSVESAADTRIQGKAQYD